MSEMDAGDVGGQLRGAVEQLRHAFAKHRWHAAVDAFTDVRETATLKRLKSFRRDEMPRDAVLQFVGLCLKPTDPQWAKAFQYILPSWAALLTLSDERPSLWDFCSALERADWQRWPNAEREAVAAFLDALWLGVVESTPEAGRVVRVFGDLSLALPKTAKLLDVWSSSHSATSTRTLASFVNEWDWTPGRRLPAPAIRQNVEGWLRRDGLTRLRRGLAATNGSTDVTQAIQILEALGEP